jgi:hypothetical protein
MIQQNTLRPLEESTSAFGARHQGLVYTELTEFPEPIVHYDVVRWTLPITPRIGHDIAPLSETPSMIRPNDRRFASLSQYLDELLFRSQHDLDLNSNVIRKAKDFLNELRLIMGYTLTPPQAAPALDGSFMFLWKDAQHHFEMEFFSNAPTEFFYEDANAIYEGILEPDQMSHTLKPLLYPFLSNSI